MADQDFNRPFDKVISPRSLAHVVIRTPRYKEMVQFYKTFLGAEATHENEWISFITYDDEHHRIAIAAVPGTTDKVRTSAGLEHIAFTFPNLKELALAYKQRKSRDILPIWSVNHGPTTSIYYQDPDGNQLETQVDNFDSVAEATEFMTSAAFAENPVGVDFDPEDLIKKLQAGHSERTLKQRANIGPRTLDTVPGLPSIVSTQAR